MENTTTTSLTPTPEVTIRRRSYAVEGIQDLAALTAAGFPLTAENMALRGWDAQGRVRVAGGFFLVFRLDRIQRWVVVGAKVRDAGVKEVR